MIPISASNSIVPFYEIDMYRNKSEFTSGNKYSLTGQDKGILAIQSFSISEKQNEVATGSIGIVDNTGAYDTLIKVSVLFDIKWGFRIPPTPMFSFGSSEINGIYERRMLMQMASKSISCSDGLVNYNFQLKGGQLPQNKNKVYSFGTVRESIIDTCKSMGFRPDQVIIDFPDSSKKLSASNQLSKVNTTDLGFLTKTVAVKYNLAIFIISTNLIGDSKIYIISQDLVDTYNLAKERNLKGEYHFFEFGTDNGNCLSIDFDCNNNGGQAFGDGSQVIVDDKGNVMVSEVNPNGKTIIYKLNQVQIDLAMKKAGSFTEKSQLVASILNSDFETDWKRLRDEEHYFIKTEQALQDVSGSGWTAKAKVIPNPLYQLGDKVVIAPDTKNTYIPPYFKSKKVGNKYSGTWQITGINQTIDSDGYSMDLELLHKANVV